jgi:hypothetical protein
MVGSVALPTDKVNHLFPTLVRRARSRRSSRAVGLEELFDRHLAPLNRTEHLELRLFEDLRHDPVAATELSHVRRAARTSRLGRHLGRGGRSGSFRDRCRSVPDSRAAPRGSAPRFEPRDDVGLVLCPVTADLDSLPAGQMRANPSDADTTTKELIGNLIVVPETATVGR